MSATLKALGLDKWTVEERLRLIGEIWDSIPDPDDVPLTDAQKADLERRLERMRTNPGARYTLEEFIARQRGAVESVAPSSSRRPPMTMSQTPAGITTGNDPGWVTNSWTR